MQANDIAMLADMARYMHNDYSSLPAGYTAADFPHADMPNLCWWYWNGGQSDTGGIVGDDWTTVSISVAFEAMVWRAPREDMADSKVLYSPVCHVSTLSEGGPICFTWA